MEKIYKAEEWSPKLESVAQSIIDGVHSVAPELEVLFMGAAALRLPGKNDLDLDVLCSKEDIRKYTEKLMKVLGEPKKTETTTSWDFEKEGFEIDIILSDPSISHVPEQKHIFDTLKSNPELLEEYRQLKISCDGLPYEEYNERKKEFYQTRIPK